jgi:TonB family protein
MGSRRERVRSILIVAIGAVLLTVPVPAAEQARPHPIYRIGDEGVKAPTIIKEVKPKYTAGAMRRQVEGNIEVEAVILADGTVGDVTVKRSLDPELDEEAVKATKQWRFTPGTKDGEPVAVEVAIELTFRLK